MKSVRAALLIAMRGACVAHQGRGRKTNWTGGAQAKCAEINTLLDRYLAVSL